MIATRQTIDTDSTATRSHGQMPSLRYSKRGMPPGKIRDRSLDVVPPLV